MNWIKENLIQLWNSLSLSAAEEIPTMLAVQMYLTFDSILSASQKKRNISDKLTYHFSDHENCPHRPFSFSPAETQC